jgi:excisionase family DNA binding protein
MPDANRHSEPTSGALLTAEEVAALLRVTPAWVYAETRRNRIPHVRLGRYVRYRADALAEWMDKLESRALAEAGRHDDHRRPLLRRS